MDSQANRLGEFGESQTTPTFPLRRDLLHGIDDIKLIRHMINSHADVNAVDDSFQTALHTINNLDIAILLIESKCNVNAFDQDSCTPLHTIRNLEIAQLLLEHKANISHRDVDGFTPLHKCVDPNIIQLFIKYKANIDSISFCRSTPFHSCINNYNSIKILLNNLDDSNLDIYQQRSLLFYRDISDETIIDLATDIDTLKLILDYITSINNRIRNDPNIEELSGDNMYHNHHHDTSSYQIYLPFDRYYDYLSHLNNANSTDIDNTSLYNPFTYQRLELLLEANADPNQAEELHNNTVLHLIDDCDIITLFINAKADINRCNSLHETPLVGSSLEKIKLLIETYNAKYTGLYISPLYKARNMDIVNYLINLDSRIYDQVRYPDRYHTSHKPILQSIKSIDVAQWMIDNHLVDKNDCYDLIRDDNIEIITLLIENNVLTSDMIYNRIVSCRSYDMMKLLIKSHANPLDTSGIGGMQPSVGATLLHDPSTTLDMAKILIESGLDPNISDVYSQVPLNFIRNVDVAKYLLDHKANPDGCSKQQPPLYSNRNYDICLLLLQYKASMDTPNNLLNTHHIGPNLVHLYLSINPSLMYLGDDIPIFKYHSSQSMWEMYQYGYNPNRKNTHFRTILSRICTIDQASLYLDYGGIPDLEQVDIDDTTHDILNLLVDCNADTTGYDDNRKIISHSTPLHTCKHHHIAKRLIENEHYSVHAVNSAKQTPLHTAYNMRIFKLLLDYNADPYSIDQYGYTPIECSHNIDTARMLVDELYNKNKDK